MVRLTMITFVTHYAVLASTNSSRVALTAFRSCPTRRIRYLLHVSVVDTDKPIYIPIQNIYGLIDHDVFENDKSNASKFSILSLIRNVEIITEYRQLD